MDKKIKIFVIIIFALFVAVMVFDANNKMNAIKNKKKPAVQEVAETGQTDPNQPGNQQDTDKQGFDAMATRAQYAAQNTPSPQPRYKEQQSYEAETGMEEIEPPQQEIHPVDTGRAETYFTFADIPLSVKVSDIPAPLTASDSIGNKYYFVNNTSGGNSLGILIKVSPIRQLLWQKEIKSFFAQKPGVQSIKVTSNSVQLNMVKAGGKAAAPVILSLRGTNTSNPYPVKFYTSAGRAPSDFAVTYIDSFTHKGSEYGLISVIDINPKSRGILTKEGIYAYRVKNGSFHNQYRVLEIPYFINENNKSRLSFIIKDEGTGVLFIATAPKTERDPAYTNAVRIPSIVLTRQPSRTEGAAPTVITEGLIISDSNHEFTYEYKE